MKIAFYINDGLGQIVFTPETDAEKAIVNLLHEHGQSIRLYKGEFYRCRGGWVRESVNAGGEGCT